MFTFLQAGDCPKSQRQKYVITDGQSASLSWSLLGPKARFLLLSNICRFVHVERPLWHKDGSVIYNCCWPSQAQPFSVPSLMGFVSIFYCLRFGAPPALRVRSILFISPRNRVAHLYPQASGSLVVASCYSQGYGGGIRTRLHTGYCLTAPTVLLITSRHGPHRKHRSSVSVSIVALQISWSFRGRCPATSVLATMSDFNGRFLVLF
jgi:hypothetical protein